MARFFDFSLRGRHYINLDRVFEVRNFEESSGRQTTIVVFEGGHTETIDIGFANPRAFAELAEPVVPAGPGFHLLNFRFFEDQPNADAVLDPRNRSPIIAWRISAYGPEPIALERYLPSEAEGVTAILCPDGNVTAPEDQNWPDVKAWAEHVCHEWGQWLGNSGKVEAPLGATNHFNPPHP